MIDWGRVQHGSNPGPKSALTAADEQASGKHLLGRLLKNLGKVIFLTLNTLKATRHLSGVVLYTP